MKDGATVVILAKLANKQEEYIVGPAHYGSHGLKHTHIYICDTHIHTYTYIHTYIYKEWECPEYGENQVEEAQEMERKGGESRVKNASQRKK